MSIPVAAGASCVCTMGTAPGQINPTNQPVIRFEGKPVASVADAAPMSNIAPCGLCTSMGNPTVQAATAAAMGVLTPQPCTPAPTGGWTCGGKVRVGGKLVLTNDGQLTCSYGGTITIVNPGQTTVQIS